MHSIRILSTVSTIDVILFSLLKQGRGTRSISSIAEWIFPKATEEGINTHRIYRKPSKKHGIKYVFSSKNDGMGEIDKRVLALPFQTRNSFES
jgi:hypothetical protein